MALVNHAPSGRTFGNPITYVTGFEIADVTDRENARTSASASAASAVVADGHRASAASQANLASSFANDAAKSVASVFPSDFSKNDAYFCALNSAETLFDPVKPPIYNVNFINDPAAPGEGRLLRTIPGIVPGSGLVTYGYLPRNPGKVYKLTLRGRLAAYPSGGRTARVTLGAALYDANGWLLTWQQLAYYDGNQYTSWTNFTHEIDFIPESSGGIPVAYWRPYAAIGQLTDWSPSDGVYDFSRFIVEEITAVKASEAAATASQNSATAADAHRASAASDASLAASYRGQAGDFATNAQQNAVAAQGHRAAAESAAGASSGSATVADGHRAAAATQANLSATYSRDALVSASEVFPSTFDRETEFFTSITGSEITAPRFDVAYPGICSYPVRTDLGKVLRIGNVPAGWQYLHLHTRKRISRASQRRYRITAKVHVLNDAPLGRTRVVATCYGMKQDFATITYDGVSYAASPGGIPQLVDATTANGIFEVGIDFWSGPTSSDTVWIVPGIYLVGYDGVATVGNIGIVDVISLKVEDVTDSFRANTQANIATAQATAADASRSVAEQAANLSAQYRNEALGHANTASTQAGIATNQQSIATAAAAAARTTSNLVARINTGSINPNPGLIEWTAGVGWPEYWQAWAGGPADRIVEATGDLTARFYADNDHQLGMVQYATGDLIRITPGKYVIDVEASISSGTTQGAGVLIFWLNGETVLAGDQLPLNATPDISGVTATWWDVGVIKRFRKVVTAPPGTNRAYVYAMANWEGFGYGMPWKHVNFHYVALKAAGIADAGFSQLESSVTTLQGAVADINGAAAFTETVVAASGSNPAIMSLKAGKNGSAINLTGDRIVIRNPVNGQIVEVAKFEGGVAQLNNAMVTRLRVAPRSDSQIFLPVMLRPIIRLGSDGQWVNYQNGETFGANPERITPDLNGLPALAAGESYDIRAVNVSPTGFTAYAKKITASEPVTQTAGAGDNVGGVPQWRSHKPSAADAFNGNYQFTFQVAGELISSEPLPGGSGQQLEWRAIGDIYLADTAGTMIKAGSYSEFWGGPNAPSQRTVTVTVTSNFTVGQTGGYEFGVHPVLGGIVSFDNVVYSTQTQSNVAPVGGAISWVIYPPLPNE